MKNLLTIWLIVSNLNLAIADDTVVAIEKGQAAPYSGILFPRADALEMRNALIDRDRYKLLSDSFQRSLELSSKNFDLQEQRVDIYRKSTEELSKQLYDARSVNSWERVGWFILGIAATVGAGYAISRVK